MFKRAYRRYRRGDFDPDRPGPSQQLAAAALMVRADQNRACGGWDERFPFGVEDVDYCARLGALGSIYYLPQARIEHLGRISSRANRAFVYRGYECGYARYLGKRHGRGAALVYKILISLDMPVRVLALAGQMTGNAMLGRWDRARRARQRLLAAGSFFLTGLPAFWRA